MHALDARRIVLAGLLAGLVMNVAYALAELALQAEMDAMIARLGLGRPGEAAMLAMVGGAFLLGILVVAIYAAFAAATARGWRAAAAAALVAWTLNCLTPYAGMLAYGILTPRHAALALPLDLALFLAGALAGAAAYDRRRKPAPAVVPAG
jgi:hypothetical protein